MSEKEFTEKLKRYRNIFGTVIAGLLIIIICGVCKFFYDHANLPAQEKENIAIRAEFSAKFDMMLQKIVSIENKVDKLCPENVSSKTILHSVP